MTDVLFRNANVLDVIEGAYLPDHSVRVHDGRIAEVTPGAGKSGDAPVIDLKGKTLMPGLCDGHVHVNAASPDIAKLRFWSPAYVTARAADIMKGMLMRGFTTVRDVGGADFGLAQAVEEGYLVGPRVLFGGRALSQTGGHGDFRGPGENLVESCYCCFDLGRICDGVPQVRQACRDEVRRGAHHLKLMVSGGVASPTDRIDSTQFSREEITAAVEEAEAANIYVAVHAYTGRAINRALECGVRSVEHGNLLDDRTVELLLERDAFHVATLSTYRAMATEGLEAGMPKELHEKVFIVLDAGLRALEKTHRAGAKTVFGTDLLGSLHRHQLSEFAIRREIMDPIDIIRAATCTAAELFQMVGDVGLIAPDARADLLVVDGDPLKDMGVLQNPDRYLKAIMKDGTFYKNELG